MSLAAVVCESGAIKHMHQATNALAVGLVLAVSVASCSNLWDPGPTLMQFGIVGTFSDDCSRPVAEGGARAIYEVRPGTYPTLTVINSLGTFQSKIVRVDAIGPTELVMYIDDPDGTWNEVDIEKEGQGFRTFRMVVHRPNAYLPLTPVNNGFVAGGQALGPYAEKCAA